MTASAMATALALAALLLAPAAPAARIGAIPRARAIHPGIVMAAVCVVALAAVAAERLSVVVAGGVGVATVWRAGETYREEKQRARNQDIVAGFLGHVVTNLRAGNALAASCEHAARFVPEGCPPPLAADLRQLVAAARTATAPRELCTNAATPEVSEVAALWSLSASRGLPVADLLSRARDRIDAAARHRAATRAALTGPKTTAVVLSILPLAGVAMGTAMGAHPLGFLFGGGLGGALLVLGTVLVSAGFLSCQYIIAGAAR
ncbi:type II secretion system F family protein [Corynebacterium liangguodongii]|uniref:Uncharacterized protein n=1 Tax=Corynebacterium liangguodongii TaxID=2079535 RepID=A0A2S0WBU0_9CORY|nr:type II secretion system F family protein [Corynebacterium liangguodongii]AWB83228.1 hypothetical protein C3E79_00970 [Corynebacterium liangguodongii]PWB98675.1 hypothetical protein DF219_10640 [Corynebacterium liangguodongii]